MSSEEQQRSAERRASNGLDDANRNRAAARLHTVVGSTLLLAIVLMVNYLALRHYTRWDWTSEARYTLSERSLAVLSDLDRDVEIILLLSGGAKGFDDVRELIQRYTTGSPRVRLTEIDPDRQPTEARAMAERFDLRIDATAEGTTLSEVAAVVVAGERHWKITRDDFIDVALDEGGPQGDVKAERALTGAIVQVISGRATKVCATTGHGEWTIGRGERGLGFLKAELERENVEVVPLEDLTEVPSDCDAVFVLGPQRAFPTEDAARLVAYAEEGGHLLLAFDPIPSREAVQPTGFERALAEEGILLDASILIETDPARLLTPDPTDRVMLAPQPHPTTMPAVASGGPFVSSLARTVRPEGDDVRVLLEGSSESFGKVDLLALLDADMQPGRGDIQGPATLAVARDYAAPDLPDEGPAHGGHDHEGHGPVQAEPEHEAEGEGGRILVFGDSDWMQDALLAEPSFANLDVLMASVGWVTERDALIAIPPRRSSLRAVVMSEADMAGVWRRVMLFLPGAFLLLGFAVWWSRRA